MRPGPTSGMPTGCVPPHHRSAHSPAGTGVPGSLQLRPARLRQRRHRRATKIPPRRSRVRKTGQRRKAADSCADYLRRKRPYLDYATALARGWPIATGVIEATCRHLVKDRLDIARARWGLESAELCSSSAPCAPTVTSTATGAFTSPRNSSAFTPPASSAPAHPEPPIPLCPPSHAATPANALFTAAPFYHSPQPAAAPKELLPYRTHGVADADAGTTTSPTASGGTGTPKQASTRRRSNCRSSTPRGPPSAGRNHHGSPTGPCARCR